MKPRSAAFAVALAVLLTALPAAHAEDSQPHGTYVWVDPPSQMTAPTPAPTQNAAEHSNILYLNPCWGDCNFQAGRRDDSRTNVSSIPNRNSTVSEFKYGKDTFNAVVACVRDMYEPFNIEVVTKDPGDTPHFEAVVAGTPDQVGMGKNVGGVSPFTCGIIDNAITYTFANIYGGSVQDICEVIAQETAHAFGLEHEYLCEDPMTYLTDCGPKRFRDVDADCGEYSARKCDCGRAAQNSVKMITAEFGPGMPTPPTVEIVEPVEGATLQPGFTVRANATDNAQVERAELWVNGVKAQELTNAPFRFKAPADTARGAVSIEVRAFDNRGTQGSATVNAMLGAPCKNSDSCDGAQVCVDGVCVDGPDMPGGLGQPCTNGAECSSDVCASSGPDSYCVEECTQSCPKGFACMGAGDKSVCWPSADSGGAGGCDAGGSDAGTPLMLLLALALGGLIFRRRRVA